MHCFCGDARLADECVELGYHISFAGNLTYKNAHEIRAAAAAVPLDRLLIETDSPYLAPTPNRGKRNDPSQVVYVAKLLADIKGISQHELLAITKANTLALFDKIKIV
jgi:TatD DNase family protein